MCTLAFSNSKLIQDSNKNTPNESTPSPTPGVFQVSSVQDRIRHFSDSGQPPGNPANNNGSTSPPPDYSPSAKKKLQSSSKAFELFESQGIVIAPVSCHGNQESYESLITIG